MTKEPIAIIVIEILTKSDCSLCDDMKEIVNRVLTDYPVKLVMTDIESDETLYKKFKERIPVLKINGIESFIYKTNETTLRHKLDKVR
ncbi:MAG: glutaredoxin family protein [Nitrospina sp.]|nr:glutaredoxin family protein [Nitrospina sp.]MBT6601760.1 glutaredoxin family protein [Nitrospina sp.]